MNNKVIGNKYNAQKFDRIIEAAAAELVKNTMPDEASDKKGRAFQRQATDNLKKSFSALPITFYQALDAFADGKSIEKLVSCKDSTEAKKLKDVSFLDLVMLCREERVSVVNEKAAINYYEKMAMLDFLAKDEATVKDEAPAPTVERKRINFKEKNVILKDIFSESDISVSRQVLRSEDAEIEK